jgi:hypothetical protein
MSAIRYPVAADAEAALASPLGRAAREREAAQLAGGPVAFVSETAGPAFASAEAARAAYPDWLEGLPEDRFCAVREVVDGAEGRWPVLAPVAPSFEDGRRWPAPGGGRLPTAWRLSVSFWRVVAPAEVAEQARAVRRRARASELAAKDLRTLSRQPLRPVRPQQPLDIGLFEAPLPEDPDSFIPDE